MKSQSRTVRLLTLAAFLAGSANVSALTGTWKQTAAGTYNWNDSLNWTGTPPDNVPGFSPLFNDIANLNNNIAGAQTITIATSLDLDILQIGDTQGTLFGFTLNPVSEQTITFRDTDVSAAQLNKVGTITDTINAKIITLDALEIDVAVVNNVAGTLVLGGGLSILGNSDQPGIEVARKDSGGILNVTGNLEVGEMGGLLMSAGTMNATGSYNTFRGGVEVTGGTLNVAGSTNVFDPLSGPAIQMTGGTMNLGSTTIPSRSFIGGPITQTVGGTLNIGVDGAISSNYLYAGAITKSAGTLRFQASDQAGSSTTLLGGARTTAVAPSLVSGNTSVSFASVTGLAAGMRVYGPGVPNGTLIQSVDAGTNTVVLSQAPTASFTDVSLMFAQGVQGITANSTNGNAELTGLASTAGLVAGMTVTGPNIPEGARILSVGSNSLTLDVPATGSGAITVNTFAVSSLNLDGGATQLWEPVRPTSTVGPTLGSVNVDPSIRLQLNGSATFNFSDLGTTAITTANTLQNSPVITINNTAGMKVGDSVRGTNIPNYARIVSINGNQVTLSVNATASAAITNFGVYENTTFSSLNSSSSTSQILATLLGGEGLSTQGTLTVGNFSAVGDVFNGVLNFTDSGTNVRLIKVGSNTLTLGGTGNNPSARVQVLEGTVVLNKASAPGVSAIGSGGILLIGDSDSSVETASLGGTFTGSAFNMATWPGASAVVNYTDQLNLNSSVELSGNGVFNLNGFSEGFNALSGTGSVLNNGSGEVSLILGQNNGSSTFSGTIVNGTGGMALVKSGTGTLTLDGLNTFSGSTLIGAGNVILGQANGALANTDTLRISGGAGLQLNSTTASTTSSNRINDSASVYLSQGTVTIRNDANVNNNVDEVVGALTVDEGSSFLRANHASNVGNRVSLNMSTLERVAGGTIAFGQVSTLANRGLGTGITPFNSATQFTVGTVPSSLLVGGSGAVGTPAVNVLLGAFGGDLNSSTNEFMTIQTALGKNYIRPLSDVLATREYATILSGDVTSNVGKVETNTSFLANTAANGIRFSGRGTHTLSDNVMVKLGGNSDNNFSPTTTVGSGMLIFSSSVAGATTRIQGGYIDAGTREFIVRANASGLIQSSISGSAGLLKDGDGQLSLYGQNEYAGITYVNGGTLRIMNAQALGATGVGNSVKVALGRTIEVGNSSIIGSNGGKDLELLGGASYSGLNGHSVLIGNTTVNAADETGKNRNAFFRVGGSFGSLTVDGNITGGGNSVDPIYSGASGRGLWFDGAGSREAMINVLGTITDQNSAPVAGGSHERLNLFVRGSSSPTEAFNEFHVNLADASQVHGQLSIRSGFVRLAGSYGTASTTDTPANRLQILLRDTGTDSPNQLGVLSMTTPGSIYNTRDISWADNNGGYSATSYGMLAAEITSGKIVIGDGFGSLDITPAEDAVASQSFTGTGTAVVGNNGNIVTLSTYQAGKVFGNLRPGMQLTGNGIPASTYIVQLDPATNRITLNKAVTGTAGATVNLNLNFNDALSSAATQRYADARLYAMEGGELEIKARLLDDGGFSLDNEVGAVTKVGKGDVRLFGAQGLNGELDGGVNLHAGTLILDYTTHNNRKITSGANQEAPITFAGGDLWMQGNENAQNTVEEIRGVVFMRPGDSQIRVSSGGSANTSTLNLGLPSNLLNNVGMLPVRYAGSSISFWRDNSEGGLSNITLEVPDKFTGNKVLPWATWVESGFEISGTYTRTSNILTVSSPNHGRAIDERVFMNFTGGGGTSGYYIITSTTEDEFTISQVGPDIATGTVIVSDPFRGKVTDFAFVTAGNSPTDPLSVRDAGGNGNFLLENNTEFMNDADANGNGRSGYIAERSEIISGEGSGFFGSYDPTTPNNAADPLRILLFNIDNDNESGTDWVGNGGSRAEPNNTFGIASGKTVTLKSNEVTGFLGGAIMIANTVGVTNKTISGGSLSSELATSYYDPDINNLLRAANDLLIHNHADSPALGGGIFTIDSNIINNPASPTTPLNLVHGGTGTTKMLRATSTGPGYTYTGSTFFNGGTIWVSDPNKLGATPGLVDVDNFAFNGGTLRIADMTAANGNVVSTVASSITLSANRGFTLGGEGATIDLAKAGTTLNYGGRISAEVHAPTFSSGIVRTSNLGVGDLTKIGPGTLVLVDRQDHTYSGLTEIKEGALRVLLNNPANVSTSASQTFGALGSNFSFIDGTIVNPGASLEFISSNALGGTSEWITLDGGELRAGASNVGMSINGVVRVRADSSINVVSGKLRLNGEGGYLEGAGGLVKKGSGDLDLLENNYLATGNWTVLGGTLTGTVQERSLGSGIDVILGDSNSLAPELTAGVMLSSEMTNTIALTATTVLDSATVTVANTQGLYVGMPISGPGIPANATIDRILSGTQFTLNSGSGVTAGTDISLLATSDLRTPLTYRIDQDIEVVAEAANAAQQVKRIGGQNHSAVLHSGQNYDRYVFTGELTLGDDLRLSYGDSTANLGIAATGRDMIVAVNGGISGSRSLSSEIRYNGDTAAINSRDLRVTFELNGNNSGWSGNLNVGNVVADADQNHIVRFGHAQAISSANRVTLLSNSTLQAGGNDITIGSLNSGVGATSVVIENAGATPSAFAIDQQTDATWAVQFRDGVNPAYYGLPTAAASNGALTLVKKGAGTATLTQANSYTGATQVGESNGPTGGTLRISTGGSILDSSPITVFGGALEFNGGNHTVSQVITLGGGAAGTKAAIRTGASTLTLGASSAIVFDGTNGGGGAEVSGTVQMGSTQRTFTVADSIGAAIDLDIKAALLGTSSSPLIKSGLGTMALSGANNFTGGVMINQGALLANSTNGSAIGLGAVTVNPGGIFGGTGTITGDVTLSNGDDGPDSGRSILSPGSPAISSGIELLNLQGNVTIGENALIDFYLGQTGFTQLFFETLGNVPSATRFRINLEPSYTPSAGATFDLINWEVYNNTGDTSWVDNLILPVGPVWDSSLFSTTGVLKVSGTTTQVSIITEPPLLLTVDPGTPATFSVTLAGTEPWLLQWRKGGVDIPGATGLSYTIPSAVEADEGVYSVVITNGGAPVESQNSTLVVNNTPQITAQPAALTVRNPGQSATLSVTATGATTFIWRKDGQVVPNLGPNPNQLVLSNLTEANQGTYVVEVGNAAGSVFSDDAVVEINDAVVISVPPQGFQVPRGTVVTFTVSATGTGPLSYQWFRGATAVGTNSPNLEVAAEVGTFGSYTVRISNVVGSLTSAAADLVEVGGDVNIVTQPTPRIVPVGGTLTLTCVATGGLPLKYQWRLNGKNISGATSSTFTATNVSTSRAGSYSCFVSNVIGTGPSNATSGAVDVGVVNTASRKLVLREGTSTTLSITAAGNVSYQWFKNDGSGETMIPSGTSRTLTVSQNLMVSDKANYYCRVSLVNGGLSLDGGMNDLTVFNAVPDIDMAGHFTSTIISEPYSFQVPLAIAVGSNPPAPDPARTPTKWVATGLPPGLTINSEGLVSGRATAVRFGPDKITPIAYLVRVTASNSEGSDFVADRELLVQPLPGGVVGVFTGHVARAPALTPPATGFVGTNFGLGGRIDVTTTTKGTYSGKLLLGATTYRFKGALNTNALSPNQSSATTTIARSKTTPLTLSFTLDAVDNLLKLGSVTDGTTTAAIDGWRSTWVKTSLVPLPASAYQGYYTFGLDIPNSLNGTATHPNIPQGMGYGSFTVAGATGKLSVAGRLSDGTSYTTATFVGPTGQVLIFRTLYAANARGSVLGQMNVTLGGSNELNTLAGTVNWWRPATPGTSGRTYAAGFDPMDLTLAGNRYTPPVSPNIVLNITNVAANTANSRINCVEANVESALPVPSFVDFNVSPTHKALAISSNGRGVTLRITPKTGVITGAFRLSQPHPDAANGGTPAVINRSVSYFGLIVKDNLGEQGIGYFMLPQLPTSAAQSNSKTPILSGQVTFTKLP